MNPALDPTYAATHRPWSPPTPEQLDALRPQPAPAAAKPTAQQVAHACGIKELEPLVRRVEELERLLLELHCDVHDSEATNQRMFERRYKQMLENQKL